MKFLVVYESMYGNTHLVADRIAEGLREVAETKVVSVHEATAEMIRRSNLVVIGGPTHVHGMSRPSTRRGAMQAAAKPDAELALDADAEGRGLREWFDELGEMSDIPAAAFDTRIDKNPVITGRASRAITRRLEHHRFSVMADPASFLVDSHNRLVEGEADRAIAWGRMLAEDYAPVT